MIFNKKGNFIRTVYKLEDKLIHTTNSYKYLGFLMTPSSVVCHGLVDLKNRDMRAYYKLKQKLGYFFRRNIGITLKLYNALVRPVLSYASDYWGCLKLPINNPIETAQMRLCKGFWCFKNKLQMWEFYWNFAKSIYLFLQKTILLKIFQGLHWPKRQTTC